MVHEPLGHREPTAANDRHAAQARQLRDDAGLFALVGDGKFAPKLVRGIGDALEGSIDIKHAHGSAVRIFRVEDERHAKARAPHGDAAPRKQAHAEEVDEKPGNRKGDEDDEDGGHGSPTDQGIGALPKWVHANQRGNCGHERALSK